MSQTTVSSFYNTRKRIDSNAKKVEDFGKQKTLEVKTEITVLPNASKQVKNAKNVRLKTSQKTVEKTHDSVPKKEPKRAVKSTKVTKNEKKAKNSKQTVVTSFYGSNQVSAAQSTEIGTVDLEQTVVKTSCISSCFSLHTNKERNSIYDLVKEDNHSSVKKNVTHSPKRCLPPPEEGTPTKKIHLSPIAENNPTPKSITPTKDLKVRRKLMLVEEPDVSKIEVVIEKEPIPGDIPSEVQALKDKLLNQKKLDTSDPKVEKLKKTLENFKEKAAKLRELQQNSSKITSVISPLKTTGITCVLPAKPAHERFKSLVDTDSLTSLVLPLKFRVLSEMFRSMDTVVSILSNRRETTVFEKVQDGVQKMMKRNFTKTHLGQIVTVSPSAYSLNLEKCNHISKKTDSVDYMLIITPNIPQDGNVNKKSKHMNMSAACLLERKNIFHSSLLDIVKKHHQNFLRTINFPIVPEDNIKRWHPKFVADLVPDIQPAKLPELPESKIYTAKDVLNRVRGTLCGRVEKALQSVAEAPTSSNIVLEKSKDAPNTPKPPPTKNALKGICSDLLEKIRARESAKLLETMTRTPDETKKLAMMERLPKIIHILWHYFIAERKAAVSIDSAVDKIIHSFNSLTTPDAVKDHLNLITKTFPGWLNFVEIRKGVYLTIDKKRNVNEMLAGFKY